MKTWFVFLFLLLCGQGLQAQVSISGSVSDQPRDSTLSHVTVRLLQLPDSNVRSIQTNKQGEFVFSSLTQGKYVITTSSLGYRPFEQQVQLMDRSIELAIALAPIDILLEEVTVSAKPAVSVRGDTIEFNADNYKTREFADADEMVAQVPGVSIDEDGNVSAHGEEVQRILVDGKEFFSTDPKVALKTLPAEVIDKLQIIDEKSEQARFSGFDDGQRNKVINIVTKPDKRKGYFGRANAGKGDEDKYTVNTALNAFRGDERVAFNLMANNINETNFGEQGRGGRRRGNSNVERGLADTYAGAANYSNSFLEEKMEVNANYRFQKNTTFTQSHSDIEYITGSRADQLQSQQQDGTVGNQEHRLGGRMKWDIDSMNRLDLRPHFNYTHGDRHHAVLSHMSKGPSEMLNAVDRQTENQNTNYSYGIGLTFMHRFNKPGQTLSFNLDGNKSSNSDFGKTLALNEYYKDAQLDRIDTNNRENTTYGYGSGFNTRLAYTHSLTRLARLQAHLGWRNTSNYSDRKTMDFLAETGQYEELNERLSNEFRNDFNHGSAGLNYAYNKRDTFRLQVGVAYEQGIRLNNRTVPINLRTTANFYSILPSLTAAYYFTKERNIEFNYNAATQTPNIDQLQDYVDNTNELYIRNGNPNLDQEYSHSFRLQYRDVNRQSGRSFNTQFHFNYVNDKIINSTFTTDSTITLFDDVILGAGGQYVVPENIDGVFSLRSSTNYGRPIKQLGINLNIDNHLYYNRNFAILNNELTPNHSYGFSGRVGTYSTFSNTLIFGLHYHMDMRFTHNPTGNVQNYAVTNQRLSNTLHMEFLKNVVIGSNLTYMHNGGVMGNPGTTTTLLNVSVGYKMFKNRNAEISIKAFDLLNNASNINRQVSEYAISDIQSNTLNRYFLLHLTYQIRNFGGRSAGNTDVRQRRGNNRRW